MMSLWTRILVEELVGNKQLAYIFDNEMFEPASSASALFTMMQFTTQPCYNDQLQHQQ